MAATGCATWDGWDSSRPAGSFHPTHPTDQYNITTKGGDRQNIKKTYKSKSFLAGQMS